ncbi:DUF2723 domain-containing protein [candidate division WOR-3 bacterium]|nr:DUF2723 domain-containing protein [candidate division WOR-3 bacterium]
MTIPRKSLRILTFALLLSVNLTFLLTTMAKGLTFIDSGELASCGFLYGVPHPTGYPLYSILIRPFIAFMSLFKFEPVFISNLFSVVCVSIAGALIAYSLQKKTGFFPALASNIFLVFHPVVWDFATETEVYALTLLLLAVLISLLFEISEKIQRANFYILVSYVCGLALGNHLMISGLSVPLLLVSIFELRKTNRFLPLISILAFTAGLSLYASMYLRSHLSPVLDWGGVSRNFQFFFNHVTGKQYQVWMFSKGAYGFLRQLLMLLKHIFVTPFFPLYLFTIPGAVFIYKKNKPLFVLLISMFLLNLLYSSSYSIPDISSYTSPSIVVLSLFCSFGVYWVLSKKQMFFFSAVVSILFIYPIFDGFRKFDKSDLFLAEDYALSIISFLPESSVYLVNSPGALSWEQVSPITYLQSVKNHRKDVLVIDKELLRRSWYVEGLNRNNEELSQFWEKEYSDFLPLLKQWELGDDENVTKLQESFENLLLSIYGYGKRRGGFFLSNPPSGPFTGIPDRDLSKLSEIVFLPYGFFFTDDSTLSDEEAWQKIYIRPVPENLVNHDRVLMILGDVKQGAWKRIYRINLEDGGYFTQRALPYLEFILSIDPEDTLAEGIINRFF